MPPFFYMPYTNILSAVFLWYTVTVSCFAQKSDTELLSNKTTALRAEGDYEQILLLADDFIKTIPPQPDSFFLSIFNDVAESYWAFGEFEKSLALYLKAGEMTETIFGKKHARYATAAGNIGYLYGDLEESDLAIEWYLVNKAVLETIGEQNNNDYAQCLNNIANIYSTKSQYAQAEQYLQEAIALYQKLNREYSDAGILAWYNLATLQWKTMNYERAKTLFLKAKEIFEKTPNVTVFSRGQLLNGLAASYFKLGDYVQAETYYLESLLVIKKERGTRHPDYPQGLNNLAVLYQTTRQYDKAAELLHQALALRQSIFGNKSESIANSLINLSKLYLEKKETDKAVAFALRSFDANTHSKIDTQNIENTLKQVLELDFINIRFLGESMLALMQSLQQDPSGKYGRYYTLCNETMLKLIEKQKNSFSVDSDKSFAAASGEHYARLLASHLSKTPDDETLKEQTFLFAEQSKSAVLSDALKSNRARTFGNLPDSLSQKEKQLQQSLDELKKALIETKSNKEKDQLLHQINSITATITDFKEQLERDYPQYHQLRYANTTTRVKDIQQQLLNDKTVLIEFFATDSATYIFRVSAQQFDFFRIPAPKLQLKKDVDELRRCLTDYDFIIDQPEQAYTNYTNAAHRLYQTYMAPALQDIKGIEHLMIVPDFLLGHLPFEALLVEPAPADQPGNYAALHYLINDYDISYSYSVALLLENRSKMLNSNTQNELLAFAAHYNPQDSVRLSHRDDKTQWIRRSLQPLPAAEKELELLKNTIKGSFLSGGAANEKNFKQQAPQYALLHLAMHGVVNAQYPILSAMAFTENGDSTEDNLLHAYEISEMELNAALVVLSACETGYGKFQQGEGVMSLARSFMFAGVPSLVVSLWEVNDASTAKIMVYFYEYLSQGLNKAQALRQAKLQYLRESRGIAAHPAFWAAFVQMGDSAPVQVPHVPQTGWGWGLWLMGAGAALVAAALWWRIRRNNL